jgi:hypothetical protein
MAFAGLFVISATIAAERAGPFIGALVVTLPVSTGPAYVFLALDHDAAFLSESALATGVNTFATMCFAVFFILLSQKLRPLVSLALSVSAWFAISALLRQIDWTAATAALANVIGFIVGHVLTRRYADAAMPRLELRFADLLARGLLVATLVALVVGLSFVIGPSWTGVLAVYPVTLTSLVLIMNRRVGVRPTAAVLAQTLPGLLGFGLSALIVHFYAVPLNPPVALALALIFGMAWNAALFAIRPLAAR